MSRALEEPAVEPELAALRGTEHGFGWWGSRGRRRAEAATAARVDRHIR